MSLRSPSSVQQTSEQGVGEKASHSMRQLAGRIEVSKVISGGVDAKNRPLFATIDNLSLSLNGVELTEVKSKLKEEGVGVAKKLVLSEKALWELTPSEARLVGAVGSEAEKSALVVPFPPELLATDATGHVVGFDAKYLYLTVGDNLIILNSERPDESRIFELPARSRIRSAGQSADKSFWYYGDRKLTHINLGTLRKEGQDLSETIAWELLGFGDPPIALSGHLRFDRTTDGDLILKPQSSVLLLRSNGAYSIDPAYEQSDSAQKLGNSN